MSWIKTLTAVVATLGMNVAAHAGLFNFGAPCGADKCTVGCAEVAKPACCKPKITRPCETNTFTYQRKVSDKLPPCCKPDSCAPAPAKCCKPAAKPCAPAPCGPPAAKSCAAPAPKACGPAKAGCGTGCTDSCCDVDPCEIAELIYESQTACHARDRCAAIHKLGDKFDCACSPEIMAAFVYALNDTDERVRAKAADEIGDQLRNSDGCGCNQQIVDALTAALADCDRAFRRQAEEGLEACGYEVVDGCCGKDSCGSNGCGKDGCGPDGCGTAAVTHNLLPSPKPLIQKTSAAASRIKTRLAVMFDLLD